MSIGIWQDLGVVIAPVGSDQPGQPNVLYENGAQILSPNGDGKIFKMWFGTKAGLCYAESNDGETWNRHASNPIISLPSSTGVYPKMFKNAGTYYANLTEGYGGSFDVYTCTDGTGINFALAKKDTITIGSNGNSWESQEVSQLAVAGKVGSTWHGYFSAFNGSQYVTCHATSTDLINWIQDAGGPYSTIPGNFDFHTINGKIYGWTQILMAGIPHYGAGASLPSDIGRMAMAAPNSASMGFLSTPTLCRTIAAEGIGLDVGQVADPCIIFANGNLYAYFTVCSNGYGATTQQIGCAVASSMTFEQLVTTYEGVFDVPIPWGTLSTPLQLATLVNDSFAGGDSSNWTTLSTAGVFDAPTFATGSANGTSSGKNGAAFYNAVSFDNDQWASMVLKAAANSSCFDGILLRGSKSSNLATCYLVFVGYGALGATCGLFIQKYVAGSYSPVWSNTGFGTFSQNDEITASIVGNTISVYQEGNLLIQVTDLDSPIASGAPGICLNPDSTGSNAAISHFSAGNVRNPANGVSGALGAGGAGATVSWSGASSGSVIADGSGNYDTLETLFPFGGYTITPSKTGYTFSPTSASETVSGVDITGVNFTGTQTLVATPTFSPVAGSYGPTQNVTISSTDSGLSGFAITYTIDGTTPVPGSHGTVYSTPVVVSSSLTIKAIASATGYANSTEADAAYTINGAVTTTTFSPAAGSYGPSQTVTFLNADSGLSGFAMYWNTTGSPTTGSTLYTGPITVSASETVYVLAVATNYSNSAIASAAYTINGACGTPTFSPVAGTYTSAQTVTISSTTGSASIYWNTTGSPTSSDTLYAGPITVSASETVYAIAEKTNFSNSAIGSAAYVISSGGTESDDPTVSFLGSVTETTDSSLGGAYLGRVRIVASARAGNSNPYLGRVFLASSAPTNLSNPLLGEVVVIAEAPDGLSDPYLGQVTEE